MRTHSPLGPAGQSFALGDSPSEELSETEGGRRGPTAGEKAPADGVAYDRLAAADNSHPPANEPANFFLISQANFALGKYREAVTAIANGITLRPDWSEARFAPRELFTKNAAMFDEHLNALRQASARSGPDWIARVPDPPRTRPGCR